MALRVERSKERQFLPGFSGEWEIPASIDEKCFVAQRGGLRVNRVALVHTISKPLHTPRVFLLTQRWDERIGSLRVVSDRSLAEYVLAVAAQNTILNATEHQILEFAL